MIWLIYACLSIGLLAGVIVVLRGGPENSLIGLNVATICAVTGLVGLDKFIGIGFAQDIAFFLIFPGVFGVLIFSRFVKEVQNG